MQSGNEDKLFWLEAIINGAQLGTWIWNVQTGETRFNERWANIIGYSLADLHPISIKTWRDLTHLEDLPELDSKLKAHFAGQMPHFHCETRMKHKAGHWMWVRDNAKVITRTADGKEEWMAGTHIDITEEVQLQTGLKRLSKISQTMPGMIYEYRLTADGQSSFPYSSDGVKAIYGVTPKEVKENANRIFDVIHPADLNTLKSSITDSAETFDEWFVEYRVIVDGKEKWVTGHAIPERNADGSISWFGQIVDTTVEKQNRLRLEQYQADLERAQRVGQLGYWQANLETGAVYWSDMIDEFFGVTKGDYEPSVSAFKQAVHPDDLAEVELNEVKSKSTGVFDMVHRIIRADGEIRWVHELADFSDSAERKVMMGTMRDVTQQKKYEAELERLSLTDELTGAYNRRYCHNRLLQLFKAKKERGNSVALAVLDIDFFKTVNDTYGHDVGEEFVLIMENCDIEKAQLRIERVRTEIENFKIPTAAGEVFITLTAGVSEINKQDQNTDDVFRRADQALYLGKQKGRNQTVVAP